MLTLVSFNINGIRARPHQLAALKAAHAPDIIGLQESKVEDASFPFEAVRALGYEARVHGQKGHYGVALLDRRTPLELERGFPGEAPDAQRRFIMGRYALEGGETLRVINGYFPQGESRAHPQKFPAKRQFYADLLDYLRTRCRPDELLVVLGDMNVAPLDRDIGIGEQNAKRWLRDGKCSFLPEERDWFQALLDWGLIDAYRSLHPEAGEEALSWFDYRSRGFEREPRHGLRIDHLLLSAPLRERLLEIGIDHGIRAMDKPSDHCPLWARLDLTLADD